MSAIGFIIKKLTEFNRSPRFGNLRNIMINISKLVKGNIPWLASILTVLNKSRILKIFRRTPVTIASTNSTGLLKIIAPVVKNYPVVVASSAVVTATLPIITSKIKNKIDSSNSREKKPTKLKNVRPQNRSISEETLEQPSATTEQQKQQHKEIINEQAEVNDHTTIQAAAKVIKPAKEKKNKNKKDKMQKNNITNIHNNTINNNTDSSIHTIKSNQQYDYWQQLTSQFSTFENSKQKVKDIYDAHNKQYKTITGFDLGITTIFTVIFIFACCCFYKFRNKNKNNHTIKKQTTDHKSNEEISVREARIPGKPSNIIQNTTANSTIIDKENIPTNARAVGSKQYQQLSKENINKQELIRAVQNNIGNTVHQSRTHGKIIQAPESESDSESDTSTKSESPIFNKYQ